MDDNNADQQPQQINISPSANMPNETTMQPTNTINNNDSNNQIAQNVVLNKKRPKIINLIILFELIQFLIGLGSFIPVMIIGIGLFQSSLLTIVGSIFVFANELIILFALYGLFKTKKWVIYFLALQTLLSLPVLFNIIKALLDGLFLYAIIYCIWGVVTVLFLLSFLYLWRNSNKILKP